uniref:Uncharacterized protein n=1 Tax=Rhizophora mucronata TaxID=61149 RepID=A0A2P2QIJ9_RHIMU
MTTLELIITGAICSRISTKKIVIISTTTGLTGYVSVKYATMLPKLPLSL